MRRRKGLHTIQRLAEYRADSASRDVGTRLRALRAEEERLRQVNSFLRHYDELSVTSAPGMTASAMLGRRQFAGRLRDAAERQRQVVEQQEGHYQQQVERWRNARSEALALQRFNERIRHREHERQERREQARLDEIAQRRR
jgi:flagellar export protein FliJ